MVIVSHSCRRCQGIFYTRHGRYGTSVTRATRSPPFVGRVGGKRTKTRPRRELEPRRRRCEIQCHISLKYGHRISLLPPLSRHLLYKTWEIRNICHKGDPKPPKQKMEPWKQKTKTNTPQVCWHPCSAIAPRARAAAPRTCLLVPLTSM